MNNSTTSAPGRSGNASIRLGAVDICKNYGPVAANRNVSLGIAPGGIHAIVGENGAGKSTLMRIFQGIEQPDCGHIIIDDTPIRLSGPKQALNLGIGMVHQEFMLAPDLTLLENLVLGNEPEAHSLGVLSTIDWSQAKRAGHALARQTGVRVDWKRHAGGAPVHMQQFVEIMRLLRFGARILILDEPTAVLAPPQVDDLFNLLRNLSANGTTIVFISHKMNEVLALADTVSVLRQGQVTFEAKVCDVDVHTIASHIVGGHSDKTVKPHEPAAIKAHSTGTICNVRNLCVRAKEMSHPLHDVSFSINKGEILGLAGVSGNGQDELVECLVGLRMPHAGTVTLDREDITHATNAQRRRLGLGYVSADRAKEGLAASASVLFNVIAGSHRDRPIKKGLFLNPKVMRTSAIERLTKLAVKYGRLNDVAQSLSGGNQQRLVFARETASEPTLLIVSQPTRGVDLNGIAVIHEFLKTFCDNGGSVLLVSEELDELLSLSNRIIVMADGRIVGETTAGSTDVTEIGQMMVMQGAHNG